jgi:hypothetical protein
VKVAREHGESRSQANLFFASERSRSLCRFARRRGKPPFRVGESASERRLVSLMCEGLVQSHCRSDNLLVRRWGLRECSAPGHGEGSSQSSRSLRWRELMGPSARAALCYCAALLCTILVLHGALARAQGLDGSGYKLVSIHDLKSGDGVVAFLELIKESPKSMSPDIKRLKLVAR